MGIKVHISSSPAVLSGLGTELDFVRCGRLITGRPMVKKGKAYFLTSFKIPLNPLILKSSSSNCRLHTGYL